VVLLWGVPNLVDNWPGGWVLEVLGRALGAGLGGLAFWLLFPGEVFASAPKPPGQTEAAGADRPGADPGVVLKSMQIMAIGFLCGLVAMGAAMSVAVSKLDPPMMGDSWAGQGLWVTLAGLVVGVVGVFAALLVVPRLTPRRLLPGEPVRQFQGEWLTRAGLLNGLGVIQLVLFSVTSNPLLVVGAAVPAIALLSLFPTRKRFDKWLAERVEA
jgi:hypothetical protein